jgi:hypothetical protein
VAPLLAGRVPCSIQEPSNSIVEKKVKKLKKGNEKVKKLKKGNDTHPLE